MRGVNPPCLMPIRVNPNLTMGVRYLDYAHLGYRDVPTNFLTVPPGLMFEVCQTDAFDLIRGRNLCSIIHVINYCVLHSSRHFHNFQNYINTLYSSILSPAVLTIFFSSFTRWNIPDSHHGSNRNYTRTTYSSMSVGFVGRLHKCKSTRCVCTDKILSSENPIFYW